MLKRSAEKAFAANRWTGIGGKVEGHELGDLQASALRELNEETGIVALQLRHLKLRRVVYYHRDGVLGGLLYYTAYYDDAAPDCTEGNLYWKPFKDLEQLDIIETTKFTLPMLIKDVKQDPEGQKSIKKGVAVYLPHLTHILWGDL